MKIYLVGGAVRDKLLKRAVTDNDYVVVGATPAEMFEKGFKSVGKDFPVFLHPTTKEEYALARTERKSGRGYHGFTFNTDISVTIEDDLSRRDLTINAIAMDDDGDIVDPYNGIADLENKQLRHVSDAFKEDPVRILRTARFLSRYAPLGFEVAAETNQLMQEMVTAGEADFLVAERVWAEFSKALTEPCPEQFVLALKACGALQRLLPEIDQLFGVPQNPEYHPEIDTGIHTLMVLKQACQLTQDPEIRFAALLHDLGKAQTKKANWPHHPNHGELGVQPIKALCERLKVPASFRELAIICSQHHISCHRAQELDAKSLLDLLLALDAQRRPERFEKFLTVCHADATGRQGAELQPYPQMQLLRDLLKAVQSVDNQSVIAKVNEPSQIQAAIYQAKLDKVLTALS